MLELLVIIASVSARAPARVCSLLHCTSVRDKTEVYVPYILNEKTPIFCTHYADIGNGKTMWACEVRDSATKSSRGSCSNAPHLQRVVATAGNCFIPLEYVHCLGSLDLLDALSGSLCKDE